ncbi:flagellar protein export ATPase FliI [Tepidibacillus decaturensis]|uniref:EscN/YscN/HrcN family type III secretion system ATPase n=1 Tax=Tepidibacillus decaturensis TaxID=1413211 RepID=A0A135L320_9BACI|nr:flagellar protein export ATPase FliI [Tepidibacillus decaturensis]KXG43386.1 EscN/YscN/HrcN family type III secretion system ATPase [Tepidibacillus decaturensis]
MTSGIDVESLKDAVIHSNPIRMYGRVTQVIGLTIESHGPECKIGDVCFIYPIDRNQSVKAEVVGFKNNRVLLMPLGELGSIGPGCDVINTGYPLKVKAGLPLLGRILNGLGEPLDQRPLPPGLGSYSTNQLPPNPLTRPRITEPISLGIRAIDALLTVGKGQRIGIFAGSGVGKSTLLGMIARNTSADVNVIGLIGERGREVRDFIERDLGEEGLKKSVIIVATSDQPALVRIKGAMIATSIAEYFRDKGLNVNLMMDSITRFAMAQREVGLAIGEPPATKGYTPSVFALLPKLLERTGTNQYGTITALYTVLVDSDDMNEPIADAVRGILDGHIVLDRKLAHKGHFPAIDLLSSISRLMKDIVDVEQNEAAEKLKRLLAVYRDAEDLINIGAYQKGSNPLIDQAIDLYPMIENFTKQGVDEKAIFEDSVKDLIHTFKEIMV